MWIIPQNHPLYSAFAQEYLDSKEALNEQSENSMSLPTWKSKPSSKLTWLRAWKRVYWIRHLFGRMLKPSMHGRFVEKYTASLADIHAPVNPLPGSERGIYTMDSFGHIYAGLSKQASLFGDSLKMWKDTFRERIRLFTAAYKIWDTQLKREYSQRKKWAHHNRESEPSSWRWPSPTSMMSDEDLETNKKRAARMKVRHRGKTGNGCGMSLATSIKRWATPSVSDEKVAFVPNNQHAQLSNQIIKWGTPTSRDYKGTSVKGSEAHLKRLSKNRLDAQIENYGQKDKATNNGPGKSRAKLNPKWSLQLMGTTFTQTWFVPLATQWLNKPPN